MNNKFEDIRYCKIDFGKRSVPDDTVFSRIWTSCIVILRGFLLTLLLQLKQ